MTLRQRLFFLVLVACGSTTSEPLGDSGVADGESATDAFAVDAELVDGGLMDSGSEDTNLTDAEFTDADAIDAGSDGSISMDSAPSGPMRLPAVMPRDLVGDFEIPPGEMSVLPLLDISRRATLDGNLTIRAGATLGLSWSLDISGSLLLEEGASIVVMTDTMRGFQIRVDSVRAEGTRANPVVFDGTQYSFHLESGAADIAYADFRDAYVDLGAGERVQIVDSRFTGVGRGDVLAVDGDGSATSLVDHCEIQALTTYIRGVTVTHTEFRSSGVVFSRLSLPRGDITCGGMRDQAQDTVFVDNAFMAIVEDDELITVARLYGPTDVSGNYFEGGVPTPTRSWLEASNDGSSGGGCDDMGNFGGPVTWTPVAAVRPATGPR